MEKIVSLCKRRGFVYPSSEIYGGFANIYDFGPLGVELKNNLKKAWWEEMIKNHKDIVGLDAAILMNPRVWKASGHLGAGFADELLECKDCRKRFKLDEIKEDKCPECGGKLSEPRKFNLMVKTFIGPVENEAAVAYLRPETCQGIYVNFLNVINSMRLKIPFGMAQIGKAFRNEINPKSFIFRTREFEQMEMQWFCRPKDADKYFDYWKEERLKWYQRLGMSKENLRVSEAPKEKRAHYAKRQIDIEYHFPFGWGEIEGIHNRGDWDLKNHSKYSGKDLSYTEEGGDKYYPHVIETSVGVERSLFAFLSEAYQEVEGGRTTTTESAKEVEVLLKLPKSLAPIKVAVLPLVKNKPEIIKKAKEVYQLLNPHFMCQYDEVGSIGRRYRRMDEIGVIVSATCDFQTLEENTITLRERDSMKQIRVEISKLQEIIQKILDGEEFLKLGEIVK
ncbi:MAG: glycine--tRNA ligase [Parcubacteria group bacterium]|nr:glycine--tRNA ligase [Parcubacteria group bacterium]